MTVCLTHDHLTATLAHITGQIIGDIGVAPNASGARGPRPHRRPPFLLRPDQHTRWACDRTSPLLGRGGTRTNPDRHRGDLPPRVLGGLGEPGQRGAQVAFDVHREAFNGDTYNGDTYSIRRRRAGSLGTGAPVQ